MHVPDREIITLLEEAQASTPDVQERAWFQLQVYRTEALGAARSALEHDEKLELIDEARDSLRERLRELVGSRRCG